MGKSFKDQLLQLGLVDKKKVEEVKKQQHKAKKKKGKQRTKNTAVDENVLLAKQAAEKKKERARKLNKERDAKLQKRAEEAQIKQLLDTNKIEKDENGIAYRFNVSGKIHRVFVTKAVLDDIVAGRLGIVERLDAEDRFEVVPKSVVEKIKKLNHNIYINLVTNDSIAQGDTSGDTNDEDDPYADYKVPDDLMW